MAKYPNEEGKAEVTKEINIVMNEYRNLAYKLGILKGQAPKSD